MLDKEQINRGFKNPIRASKYIGDKSWRAAKIAFLSRYPVGTHVLSEDWDILIILDCCRVDALRTVADEYPFIHDVQSMISRGSHSAEWMSQTFVEDYEDTLRDTGYISANPFSKTVVENHFETTGDQVDHAVGSAQELERWGSWNLIDPDKIGHLEHVWEYTLQEGTNAFVDENEIDIEDVPEYITPPEYVTDRGINLWRSGNLDRMVLHYWQPHTPYVSNAISENRSLYEYEQSPREYIQSVSGNREQIFSLYLDDLRYALDSIQVLLNNVDAEKVVISADHGEAFGEYGQYKHPITCLNPHVKKVPWTITSAINNGTYEPELGEKSDIDHSPEEVLTALGYK